MIDPFRHMPLNRRVTLAVGLVNALLCLAVIWFALR